MNRQQSQVAPDRSHLQHWTMSRLGAAELGLDPILKLPIGISHRLDFGAASSLFSARLFFPNVHSGKFCQIFFKQLFPQWKV
ncbi:hypothetical protein BpHYR1_034134 [Brachionus plicatilis]|uniref:Uncharacterized protein n=1 Tax=Brachionus plicatilis TaxID=10195 RepID=A0A3M7S6D7_BRAPC|nr:hypothetical protein BpHYR1_034134 [Brachionus plicatilis]